MLVMKRWKYYDWNFDYCNWNYYFRIYLWWFTNGINVNFIIL